DIPASPRGIPRPSVTRSSTSYACTFLPWMIADTSGWDWPVNEAIRCCDIPTRCRSRNTFVTSRAATASRISRLSQVSGPGLLPAGHGSGSNVFTNLLPTHHHRPISGPANDTRYGNGHGGLALSTVRGIRRGSRVHQGRCYPIARSPVVVGPHG